jgi:arylsulfatase
LFVDGELVGQGDIPVTTPLALGLTSGLVVGANPGAPVTPDYKPPFKFTGKIFSVTVDTSGEMAPDIETKKEAEMRMAMARQ